MGGALSPSIENVQPGGSRSPARGGMHVFTLLAPIVLSALVSHSPTLAPEQRSIDAVMVVDKGAHAPATEADKGAGSETPAAGKAKGCEECGMGGCGCSNAANASEPAQAHAEEGSAASSGSNAKAAGLHSCGCMRGKNP
jgi:hypothetical protein